MTRPASGLGQRAKWDAFWNRPRVEAEATQRVSVSLALELMASETELSRPRRVLDLGCGAGRAMELLHAAGCDVVGVDLATGALAAARQRLGRRAHLLAGDAFQLGLASGTFDVVLSLGYASVGSYPGVQEELARVLRPGGVALVDFRRIGFYHLPWLPFRGGRLLRAWRQGAVSLPALGLRPAAAWAVAGLRLETVRLFNTYPPPRGHLSAEQCVQFEQRIGRPLAPLLARTALARFRRVFAAG